MKAVRFHRLGGPDTLVYEDAPDPVPGPGQALLRVAGIGVSYADVSMRYSKYFGQPRLPQIPGLQASGIIEALGPGAEGWNVGDRVMAIVNDAYAEWVCAEIGSIYPAPEGLALREAAVVPIGFFTAWGLLYDVGGFAPGQTVIVTAAAGSTGSAILQMIRRGGGRAIGLVGASEKERDALAFGAEAAVSSRRPDRSEALERAVGPNGADLLLDGVGGPYFTAGWNALRRYGRAVSFGTSRFEPTQVAMGDVIRSHRSFTGFFLPTMLDDEEKVRLMREDLWPALASGALRPRIGGVWPLREAPAAHRLLENRKTTGMLLLVP